MHRPIVFALALLAAAVVSTAAQQEAQPPARLRRPSPPQPQQQQGVEYFVGTWSFSWTGRESPVSSGPRSGTVTFARRGQGTALDIRTEGKNDDGAAYKESGTAEWNPETKTLTITEKLAAGAELTTIGDWSSPIGIRAESEPLKIGSQTVKVRRLYSIHSAQSFSVTEEISIDGKPYQRLGNGQFKR